MIQVRISSINSSSSLPLGAGVGGVVGERVGFPVVGLYVGLRVGFPVVGLYVGLRVGLNVVGLIVGLAVLGGMVLGGKAA